MSREATNWRERHKWLWVKTEGHCAYCGLAFASYAEMTDDHIVPRARGGSNSRENRLPCCKSCNSVKGARSLDYLRDAHQRRIHGRPAFTTEQLQYLADSGFQFPVEDRFLFHWEKLGTSFAEQPNG